MPELIAVEDLPRITRTFGDAKYKELTDAVKKLLSDPKQREKQGLGEKVTKDEFGAMAQAVRNAAKSVGRRVVVLFDETHGKLTLRDNGAFVPMSAEDAAERAAKAAKTKAEKAAANGKPVAKATKSTKAASKS